MDKIVSRVEVAVRVNIDRTVKHRIGGALRQVAEWIDGRFSVSVEIESSHSLSRLEMFDIVQHGMDAGTDHMIKLATDLATQEAAEDIMRDLRPGLYDIDNGGAGA